MIKNERVYGLEESIKRSAYPMEVREPPLLLDEVVTNPGDEIRALKLARVPGGTGHDNFMKGIIVQFDLQFPEYFSPQLQRYSWIDIISSQSKMHRIMSRPLSEGDFVPGVQIETVDYLNHIISRYHKSSNENEKKRLFNRVVTNLPCGYLKWMGISTNYLQLKTIYKQRRNHKLAEWHEFCDWIETLPMSELITGK